MFRMRGRPRRFRDGRVDYIQAYLNPDEAFEAARRER